jgi:putative membrane protein
MRNGLLLRWLLLVLAVTLAAHIVPGISYDGFGNLLIAALVLALLNVFIKPLLMLISLPIIVLSLGLFIWFLNAVLLMLAAAMVRGFSVASFGSALLGSLIISLISVFFGPGDGPSQTTVRVEERGMPGDDDVEVRRGPPPGKGPIIDV